VKIKRNAAVSLFKGMARIRAIEDLLALIYPLGEMRTPTHFSIGQEAVSVGVIANLKNEDAVFASHRCHAAYLAKGGDMNRMTAELFGRVTGSCGGISGSAHLSSPEKNMFSAPILGSMVPVAVGAALSLSMDGKKNIAAVFCGDAAIEEGVFSESINFAVVKGLPVLFVCENNFFSTHTHIKKRQPSIPIYKRISGLGIRAKRIDGNDVTEVYKASSKIINSMRKTSKPYFLECQTYRFKEHVGPNIDYDNPYRTRRELSYWMSKCPVKRMEQYLIKNRALSPKGIQGIKDAAQKEAEDAVRFARRSAWPRIRDILKNVY